MKVLVTGGAGFIGSTLIRYLIKVKGISVINVDSLTYSGNLLSLEEVNHSDLYSFKKIDIIDSEGLRFVFGTEEPDAVMHLAAESSVDRSIEKSSNFIQSNIVGTYSLLEETRHYWNQLSGPKKENFKFCHISTDEVYGSLEYDDRDLFREDTPYDPRNPYSATKASAEHFVTSWHNTYGLPYVITGCSNNYGKGQHFEKLIPKVILNAMNHQVTYMYDGGEQIRDWIHVMDHCSAIWSIEEKKVLNDKFNVGAGCELQNIEVTKKILDLLHKPYDLIGVSYDRPGQDKRYGTDFSKLTAATGWTPSINFDDGLKETVQWYIDRLPGHLYDI